MTLWDTTLSKGNTESKIHLIDLYVVALISVELLVVIKVGT